MNRISIFAAALVMVLACSKVHAVATGGPGGTWPASWPAELEPLRKQAWTWRHEFTDFYDIPFATREEFESAWPHILKLKAKGEPITLVRGPYLNVGSSNAVGVQIRPAVMTANAAPLPVGRMVLVVDSTIIDLNRIALPGDTPIIDERFKLDDKKTQDAKTPGAKTPDAKTPAAGGEKTEPKRPAASAKP